MENRIVVTGGNGLVGSYLKARLPQATYLSSKEYNLTNQQEVNQLFKDLAPTTIVHLAAKVGGIADNINYPTDYFEENILMNTLLLKAAYNNNVSQFLGVLSTCIYPDVHAQYPMEEKDIHASAPTPTNFSYAYAKRCLAVQLDTYLQQHNLKNYNYLIPCNLYGEHDGSHGDKMHFVTALLDKIIKAKNNGDRSITLYGDGTPLRQFLYAKDFAEAIALYLEKKPGENINIATKEVYSIDQIARIGLKACDAEHLTIQYNTDMPNGQFRKDVSTLKQEQFLPELTITSLYDGIKKVYEYLQES